MPGRHPCCHFYDGTAQAPNVGVPSVVFLPDNFGGHPVGSAFNFIALIHGNNIRVAEVRQLADPVLVDQHVGTFDISVDN